MSLNFICDGCGKPLDEPGALLFSPPSLDRSGRHTTVKFHVGVCCWDKVYWFLMSLRKES